MQGPVVLAGQPDFVHGFMFQSNSLDDQQNINLWHAAMNQISNTQKIVQRYY